MAHTFDIRFARSAGLAALLEAPTNSFRWTGSGRLSIDAQGISVAARRGLLSLLARNRTRRIPTANLKEVFREGDALRVEFATEETARASLKFWAHDRDTAAKIVQLLPTSRTVELEERAAAGKFQFDRRILTLLAVTIVAVVGAALWLTQSRAPTTAASMAATGMPAETPVAAAPDVERSNAVTPAGAASASPSAADPWASERAARAVRAKLRESATTASAQPAPLEGVATSGHSTPASSTTLEQPELPAATVLLQARPVIVDLYPVNELPLPPRGPPGSDAFVIPIKGGTQAWNEALRQLAMFGSESDDLLADLRSGVELVAQNQISRADLVARLSTYEQGWWDVTFRILDTDAFSDPALTDLRATLLACARYRRHFLSIYAEGLRRRDSDMIKRAQSEQARADELNLRARRYID